LSAEDIKALGLNNFISQNQNHQYFVDPNQFLGLEGLEKMNLLNKRLKMVESIKNGMNGLHQD
jgi:hypothetical protein